MGFFNSGTERCGDLIPHDMHNRIVTIERACSGKTPCGTETHDPHMFLSEESRQCEGICKCPPSIRGEYHSPGFHK